jgi:hypothetical protein
MESFFYQVPAQREIRNFVLTLVMMDTKAFYVVTDPEGDVMKSGYEDTDDHRGAILTWKLDRMIMAPKIGIDLFREEQAYNPYGRVLRMIGKGPNAFLLLGTVLALTLLIQRERLRLLDLMLLSAAYLALFLTVTGASDYLGLWGSLVLGVSLIGMLAFLIYRNLLSNLSRVLVYALVGFFAVTYPLTNFLIESHYLNRFIYYKDIEAQRNAFEGIVQVGLIVYLFGLALHAQLKTRLTHKTI